MSEDKKEEINFVCPICNKECVENEEIHFDIEKLQMYHVKCFVKKEEDGSKNNDN